MRRPAGRTAPAPSVITSYSIHYTKLYDKGIWLLPGHTATELIRRIAEAGGSVYLYDGKAFLRDHGDVSSSGWEQALFDLQVAAYLLAPEEGTPNLSKLRERS